MLVLFFKKRSLIHTVALSLVTLLFACSHQGERGTQSNQPAIAVPPLTGLPLACHEKVLIPALFRESQRRIRVFEGSPEFINIPAEITWETKRIQIEPARFPVETVPAQYRDITKSVVILRERTEVLGEEAVYKTVSRPVTIQPAYTRWKPNCTGDAAACLEPLPTKMTTLKQQFIEIPPRTVQKRIPAEVIKVGVKLLVKPGQGTGTPIPARYRDIRVGHVSKIWQIKGTPRPSRFEDVPIKEKIRQEQVRELPVVCANQMNSVQARSLQQRLRAEGYKVAISGRIDQMTRSALLQYQQDNDLAVGALTLETLRKLALM